ncbi:MAG TPA: hypothetical protein PKD28_02210 [Candidatus Saccharibacteria bacterium]|mgnify:CR=1 FL=1|nr:hypothetical protein [Candidatus Saccharibacteria bacterium]
MVGFIGFLIAAIIIGWFAVSFYRSFNELAFRQRAYFSVAFLMLAAALFVWGIAPLLNNEATTPFIVFVGDVLLLIGSGFLLEAQFKRFSAISIVAMSLIGAIIIGMRAFIYEPAAFVQNGILHFNLEGEPRILILALLAFLWMPLGTRITQLAVQSKGLNQFSGVIAVAFIVSLVCAAVFIGARQDLMVIASFAALAFSFLILSFIPSLINRYSRALQVASKHKEQKHGK